VPISRARWVRVDGFRSWKSTATTRVTSSSARTTPIAFFFTYGRDIRLSPDQKGDPLNYLSIPYAET